MPSDPCPYPGNKYISTNYGVAMQNCSTDDTTYNNISVHSFRETQNSMDRLVNRQNSNRTYTTFQQFREYYVTSQEKPKIPRAERDPNTPALFMGRDPSYPNELNELMKPFFCSVCNCRLNSIKSSNIHYESKAHDRHITAWLKRTYTDKGITAPKLQRFVTEQPSEIEGVYHCELCKLELTSVQHALQHYNGKRHRLAASRISSLTGIGYFNVEGKWVETGKVIDKDTGKETPYIMIKLPTGFEPVVLQTGGNPATAPGTIEPREDEGPPAKKPHTQKDKDLYVATVNECKAQKNEKLITSTVRDKSTAEEYETLSLHSQESPQIQQTPQEALDSLYCKVCEVTTTSKDQMLMHLKGARHTKKLKALGELPVTLVDNPPVTILESLDANDPQDTSMYRTPSGSYYCKFCNVALPDMISMRRHILGKKHLIALKKNVEA